MLESAKSILSKILFICIASFLLIGNTASAQNFKLLRYDENYEFLKDSNRNFYERLKFIPLNQKKDIYMSIGGEARYEYVDFNNEDWGRFNVGHNNFLLQRYDLHADIHLGKTFRIFAQLRSALEDGRTNGARGIDEDQLNVQNLFLDVNVWQQKDKKITIRAGRQELDYGSGRLISVREGPNARLYFTGGKLMYTSSRVSVDAFAMMADTVYTGVFDNKMSKQLNLWGAYSKIIFPKAGNLDLYYLGFRRDASVFEEGIAPERRHTIGSRLWKYGGGFIYNLEAAYQFGTFGSGDINAWTGSIDIGYMFENIKFKPTINLRNDYISGDKNQGNGNLQTFNPLYPKGGYFGFSPQVGPVNLIDIHPYATLDLLSNLKMQVDVVLNWRYSTQDGVYRPSGILNLRGSDSDEKYIGTAYLANFTYGINKYISVVSGIQYFKTGAFINDVIPNSKDGVFFNARLTFKF
ncbi:alginate export family protein [Flavobacterium nitrogenifigens]|uniref:Alginate export n=1 Tax=Flavobacterium nitrogenifigens TaxID=1617283 RepID=A0A521BFL3_9FLAO|nr:alginate export family protein [Flavobacterium nitrogenifigens]KAF2339030.1 alginate export family protein [Flavobacterium nitrogenifigens]SMO45896.1 Alginate export [Flavobacterium nitrogenifigens]